MDRSWPILAAKSAKNDPNLAPQDDPKSIKNRVQKMIKILIDFKTGWHCIFGPDRRNALASWRGPKGGPKTQPKNYAVRCRDLLLRSWHLWPLQHLRLGVRDAVALAPAGRAADCLPQGGTPPPARPFTTAPRVKRFRFVSISAISATLISAIVLGIVSPSLCCVLQPFGAILKEL